MYTLTYIYTSTCIYQIKQSVLLSYIFIVSSIKKIPRKSRMSRDLDFDLEL